MIWTVQPDSAGNAHPHEPEAEAGEHRFDDRGDARRNALLDDQARLDAGEGIGFAHPSVASATLDLQFPTPAFGLAGVRVTKKSGSRGAHSHKTDQMSSDRYEVSKMDGPNIAICPPRARAKQSAIEG